MQSGGISRKDVFRKWDEGLFDGKRTPYIIVCGLVYVGGKYWFVVLLHKKCFQWKPCAKAAGNQSRVSWHLQHMSVYVYLYMSIYRVLSLHFECVILICTRLWQFWLNLKPAGHCLVFSPCLRRQATELLQVRLPLPSGAHRCWELRTLTCRTRLFQLWPPHLTFWAVEFLPQAQYLPRIIWVRVWAMGHLHLARRLCTRMLCFVPQLLCVLGWVNLPWTFWRSTTNLI